MKYETPEMEIMELTEEEKYTKDLDPETSGEDF